MSKLLAVISPAKLLDDQSHYPALSCTQPQFLTEAEMLVSKLKKLPAVKLSELMKLSKALGEENKLRYNKWSLPFSHANAHPAILMFKGEVYRGMNAREFNDKDFKFASENLRILSGLYGLLRPLDLVMPYRLMMGTAFSISSEQKNLYSFWGTKIAEALKSQISERGILLNLSSDEYFKSIDIKTLNRTVVQCEFREKKGDQFVMVNTYTKLARGKMARFLIENKIQKTHDLQAFDSDGYHFNVRLSGENKLVFTRG